jgi:hypothetical protein
MPMCMILLQVMMMCDVSRIIQHVLQVMMCDVSCARGSEIESVHLSSRYGRRSLSWISLVLVVLYMSVVLH